MWRAPAFALPSSDWASSLNELVEEPTLVLSGRRPVAISYCCQRLLFSHSAQASRHAIASRIFGSILYAAITS